MKFALLLTVISLAGLSHAGNQVPIGAGYPVGCFKMSLPVGNDYLAVGEICTTERNVKENNQAASDEFHQTGEFSIRLKDLRGKVSANYKMANKVHLGPGAGIDRVVYSNQQTRGAERIEFEMYDDNPDNPGVVYGKVQIDGKVFELSERRSRR